MSLPMRHEVQQGYSNNNRTYDSGPLGPLDASFAESIGLKQDELPQSIDEGIQQLEYYAQRLEDKLREFTTSRDSAKAALSAAIEKKNQSKQLVREITERLLSYHRNEIVNAFRQWTDDEQKYTCFKEEVDRLDYLVENFSIPLLTVRIALYVVNAFGQQQSARVPSQPIKQDTESRQFEQLLSIQETEQQHLAVEIDQRLSTSMSNVMQKMQVTLASSANSAESLSAIISDVQDSLRHILLETQVIIAELQPDISEYGLSATLENYLHKLGQSRQFQIFMSIEDITLRLPAYLERALFHVAVEAVSNSLLHSRASKLFVALREYEDSVILTVEDDGIGFHVDAVMANASHNTHSGLGKLRLEADILRIDLGIESSPDMGTRIDCVVTV